MAVKGRTGCISTDSIMVWSIGDQQPRMKRYSKQFKNQLKLNTNHSYMKLWNLSLKSNLNHKSQNIMVVAL